jgi:prevent-host-death family protein
MIHAPQIEPVSNLVKDHKAVFAKLGSGPVFLAQRSKPAAVLVSIDEWTEVVNRLEELQDIVDVLEAELELATGKDHLVDADLTKLERMAHGDPIPA